MSPPNPTLSANPATFRDALTIPGGRGAVKLGAVLADFQRADFAAMDRGFLALAAGRRPDVGRFWLERTKGASKDSDLAAMLLWLLAFSPRSLSCQVGAADADQADELRKAAKGILRLNPWLGDHVEVQAGAILNPKTDSRADIIAADVTGSHGARPDLLILNELSHVGKQEFAETLLDNASKVPHGLVCIATNAGFVPSWQWDWRENARTSDRWHFSAFKQAAPWLDQEEIAEAKRRNSPSRFKRLWQGEWVAGSGDALEPEDLEAAITMDGPLTGPVRGMSFYGGLDLSVSRHHSSLVVVGLTRERVRLASVQSWKPGLLGLIGLGGGKKIDLAKVQEAVVATHRKFHLVKLAYDPFQAALLAQNCVKLGVPMEETPFTGSNISHMATVLLERFSSRQIDLYRDEQLLSDLGRLRLVDKGFGGYKLESPQTKASGHGDRATGLVLALRVAALFPRYGGWEAGDLRSGGGLARRMPRGVFADRDDGPADKYGARPAPLDFLN